MTAPAPALSRPRTAALDRDTAYRLAATEYARIHAVLRDLSADDWNRSTDCPGWDVTAMAAHVLGMAEMAASVREMARQQRLAGKAGGGIDALTDVQVRTHAGLDGPAIVTALETTTPRALRGRRRMSRIAGRVKLPEEQVMADVREYWRIGFLLDVVLTRDVWMHRVDVCRATGHELELTPGHDGVLVADVVAEWAQRHGRPYRLVLTGPAGGRWSSGTGGEELELDAVEFCRVLSGRGSGAGLLGQQVPF
ncbi:maleylpyruvate isomerase family mycothiol-dependent enzyme [Blastococcus goldschmidtiae]|uniref:Maleylpyruvate isomerase family mycothiol-dependent enzyme n=1 Tax=Blastococcus goldschmidtiae TaxID=3075546 RepID=A0ABU2K899_9ACTN|nr:maleylpyruvate isomerase family mycothiol-dependent enzyme [Blastococcus sp. DSM 46792]MDT0276416.1 maleylpyruvate isomerase family mycothiol-dependent enzyme [Blastococcus sp. DSM 46792]